MSHIIVACGIKYTICYRMHYLVFRKKVVMNSLFGQQNVLIIIVIDDVNTLIIIIINNLNIMDVVEETIVLK